MTCHRCNVEMQPGKALQNTWVGSPDFLGDTGKEGTMSHGQAILVDCLKCPECGHSVTEEKIK